MENQCGCECGHEPSRRVVLGVMAAAAVAMPALSHVARADDAPGAAAGGTWVKAGKPSEVADKSAKVLKGADMKTQLILVREGNVIHAIAPKCSHKGCDVAPVAGKEMFHCKCHGAEFDFDGKNTRGPGKGANVPASLDPLGHFALRLNADGVIEVDTSKAVAADATGASLTIG